jgi:hypothetical protein
MEKWRFLKGFYESRGKCVKKGILFGLLGFGSLMGIIHHVSLQNSLKTKIFFGDLI